MSEKNIQGRQICNKTTQPIKSKHQQKRLLAWYAEHDKQMYIFALIMIYTGFRQGDVRYLTVNDVRGDDLCILERKTRYKVKQYEEDLEAYRAGKRKNKPRLPKEERKIKLHKDLRKMIRRYIVGKSGSDYLFPSSHRNDEPLSYFQIRNRLRVGADAVGLKDFCTHALRKTAAWNVYIKKGLIEAQKFLGHKSVFDTEKYLGLNQEMVDDAVDSMDDLTPDFEVCF